MVDRKYRTRLRQRLELIDFELSRAFSEAEYPKKNSLVEERDKINKILKEETNGIQTIG